MIDDIRQVEGDLIILFKFILIELACYYLGLETIPL